MSDDLTSRRILQLERDFESAKRLVAELTKLSDHLAGHVLALSAHVEHNTAATKQKTEKIDEFLRVASEIAYKREETRAGIALIARYVVETKDAAARAEVAAIAAKDATGKFPLLVDGALEKDPWPARLLSQFMRLLFGASKIVQVIVLIVFVVLSTLWAAGKLALPRITSPESKHAE